jgi:predicted GIY-YIG superfamily endonuclease
VITPTLILPHQGGGEFLRELDAPQLCCGVLHYEIFEEPENAILREKKIKAGSRRKKIDLINSMNNEWRDLYEEI